jgi:hypothetical protein
MPGATASHAHGLVARVDAGVIDQRKINDEAVITNSRSSRVVAAAPHRDEHSVLTTKIDCGDNVGDVGAPHDQTGPAVNHTVIYLPCFLVTLFARLDELASET